MTDWREEEVGNETRARDINEWIEDSHLAAIDGSSNPYVCECSDGNCKSMISLTHVEYEEVRELPTHFAIALDLESPDLDLLVSDLIDFYIVGMLPVKTSRLAFDSDQGRTGG
jgi:hypothetical protein